MKDLELFLGKITSFKNAIYFVYLNSDWIDPFSPQKLIRQCAKKPDTKH